MKQKNESATKSFFGGSNKKKPNKKAVHIFLSTLGFFFIKPLINRIGAACSGLVFIFESNIDGETCTTKWVIFPSVL